MSDAVKKLDGIGPESPEEIAKILALEAEKTTPRGGAEAAGGEFDLVKPDEFSDSPDIKVGPKPEESAKPEAPEEPAKPEAPEASEAPEESEEPAKPEAPKKPEKPARSRGRRVLGALARLAAAALAIFIAYTVFVNTLMQNDKFVETFYVVQSDEVVSDVRTVMLSDLHLKEYGKDNSELISRVAALKPDFITVAGDMLTYNAGVYEPVYALVEKLCDIAPVYYAFGNHEMEEIVFNHVDLVSRINQAGATVVHDGTVSAEFGGAKFAIGGLSEYAGGIQKYAAGFMDGFMNTEGFKLLITHYPGKFSGYLEDYEIDLALCGHEHGGIVRLPLIGALYSEDRGFLPDLTEGMQTVGNSLVVVSRGLGDSSDAPRINNPPELVIVDIQKMPMTFDY